MEKRKRFPKIDEASLLETMLAAPDELIVVVNKNGYIENMSQAYGDFLGIQVQNAIGRHVTEVIENTRMDIVVKTGVPETGETQDIHGEKMIATRIPIRKNGMVIGAYGRVLVRNTRELHMLHDKLSSIEMELNMYKRTFEKINTAKYTVDDIIGDCSIMQDLKDSVRKVAKTNSNVLIMGESGTGKELFAHSIHAGSMRRKAPFVCVNCGSIPEQLIESELFGYEEGAFTGARKGGKIGLFPAAHGGTIFLDEIGELPLSMQVRLLRVLQDREIQRVGSNVREKVNVRVVAATNRNLEEAIKAGQFREDLFYRLNVMQIEIPPLRDRREDIPVLCDYYLDYYNKAFARNIEKVDPDFMRELLLYDWKGNVRELKNIFERCFLFSQGNILEKHVELAPVEREARPESGECIYLKDLKKGPIDLEQEVAALEKRYMSEALKLSGNNLTRAAALLGVTRFSMKRKMEREDGEK